MVRNGLADSVHIKLLPGNNHGKAVVQIYFRYDERIILIIKTLPGIRWDKEERCWFLPGNKFDLNSFLIPLRPWAEVDYSELRNPSKEIYSKKERKEKQEDPATIVPAGYLEKLERRRYSQNTIKTYLGYMRDFVKEHKYKDLTTISPE